MTAEIAVMNCLAIALAADSAASTDTKVFHANKLFALSKYHPVGIMVYHCGTFLGVPWDTIIKEYRSKKLKDKSKPSINDYSLSFRTFLEGFRRDDIIENQDVTRILMLMLDDFGINKKLDLSSKQINEYVSDALSIANNFPIILDFSIDSVVNRYRESVFSPISNWVISYLPNNQQLDLGLFNALCANLLIRRISSFYHSGVVVAGFGDDELFPHVKCFEVDGICMGKLRILKEDSEAIDANNYASIMPFAERSVADMFLTGVTPDVKNQFQNTVRDAFPSFAEGIVDSLIDILPESAALLQQSKAGLVSIASQAADELIGTITAYSRNKYVDKTVNVVRNLAPEELANLAKSLISLTSLRKRVSDDLESVGGPVDVALITKGDGFIWIERKHYFKPELNLQFVQNYIKR